MYNIYQKGNRSIGKEFTNALSAHLINCQFSSEAHNISIIKAVQQICNAIKIDKQ